MVTGHVLHCDCLDCLGGVPAEPTRVYSDAEPGPVEQDFAQAGHGDRDKSETIVDSLSRDTHRVIVSAWDEQARAAGLSRRAWMRRVLNEAAGVR
jgi:hypothetical protein